MVMPLGHKTRFCRRAAHDTFVTGRDSRHRCKICVKEIKKIYRIENSDVVKADNDKWLAKHPEHRKIYYNDNKAYFREQWLKNEYGITLGQYYNLFYKQNGLCLGCGKSQSEFKKAFAVDHNHKTGRIRGLLCYSCNILLGHAKEDPNVLRKLADYLEESVKKC